MVFGLKVNAGEFLKEGTVNISLGYSANPSQFSLTPEEKTKEFIFGYSNGESWYGYTELDDAVTSMTLEAEWQKNDTTSLSLYGKYIYFCRLKQSIVDLTFFEDEILGKNSLSIKYEDAEIEEVYQSYIHGDDQGDYVW